MIQIFKQIGQKGELRGLLPGAIYQAIMITLTSSLPILIVTFFCGMLSTFLISGPVFSTEVLKPDLQRLNPVTNIKNWFKMKTIFEVIKSILKLTGAVIIIYGVMAGGITDIVATAGLPLIMTVSVFNSILIKVLVRIGIFFILIAVFDIIFQKKNFAKEMKMEKHEVKQEYKDSEGDPHMKGKRQQTAREMAYSEGPKSTAKARTVITNPAHIAIALKYDKVTERTPRILIMGRGVLAERIIQVAEENDVPVMRNVDLAQELYKKGQINQLIPTETFDAVAEIILFLEKMEREKEVSSAPF